mmetsp:Transcript_10805/g.20338  ORF Transcript_10805/g.20338 Transcript_10805/m.20338 type:complete len:303 (+) Transcript_10805:1015-1923(+)
MIGVRRDESVAFFRPVALRHLVDIQQQALVLRLHPGKRLLLQALQESLSEKCTCFQRIRAAAARREAAGKAVLRSQRELVQVQVHTLRHLWPLAQLEPLRHKHGPPGLCQLHARHTRLLALDGVALRQLKAVQTKLHPAVNGLQAALPPCHHVQESAILQLDARIPSHVPQLRDLGVCLRFGCFHDLLGHRIPRRIQSCFGVNQILGHHRRLGKLAQMEHNALALSDQVEVAGESVSKLLQRMVGQSHRGVLQALLGHHLLARFNTHLHVWDKCVVFSHADLRLLHHEPLTTGPSLVLVLQF